MRHFIFVLVCLSGQLSFFSQELIPRKNQKEFYFTWGYTRATYSKSSIHFRNLSNDYNEKTGRYDYYDFTVRNAVAHDRADFDEIGDINITVPQYVFRLGYTFSDKWGMELNFDHTKYIVDDYQVVQVEGVFNDRWVDQDTVLDPASFLHFEHSDGANFWMLNVVRRWELLKTGDKFKAEFVFKPGAGLVIPRTDVTLYGQRLNNKYHVSGWVAGVEAGLRISFLRNGFFELVGKGSFATYTDVLVMGKNNGTASHQFFTGQATATLGFRLESKK